MNYDLEMEKQIENLDKKKNKLLLHACCAPCSSAVLERISKYFDITILYYNPNITNEDEYQKRLHEIEHFVKTLKKKNIKVLRGRYNPKEFFDIAKGLEKEKERGKRCYKCYELRLKETAKVAEELNFDYFTTTLSISPYKNSTWLNEIGTKLDKEYTPTYLYADFKKKNGYKRSIELSKNFNLYRQDYCGCIYSKIERDKEKSIQTTSFQGDLVNYYDIFFLKNSNFQKEINILINFLKENKIKSILDVGCGTGEHDKYLKEKNFKTEGIDISKDMIAYAKNKNKDIYYECLDITKTLPNKKYDCVIALSHVIDYQLTKEKIKNMINNIYQVLNKNGYFYFNFYNLNGIISKGLSPQEKIVVDDEITIKRKSNAILTNKNILNLEYHYYIKDKDKNETVNIKEKLICFNVKDLVTLLEENNFKVINITSYLKDKFDEKDWNIGIICQKN